MSTIAKILKEDIQRIARKELSQLTKLLNQSTASLEKTIKTLSRRIETLEQTGQSSPSPKKSTSSVKPKSASKKKSRGKPASKTGKPDNDKITSQDIIKLRKKLGLSQEMFAERINGTSSSVSVWERKKGVLNIKNAEVKKTILDLMNS